MLGIKGLNICLELRDWIKWKQNEKAAPHIQKQKSNKIDSLN